MSSYYAPAFDPKAGTVRQALWIDDYFGRYRYGVRFDNGGPVYRPEEVAVEVAGKEIASLRARLAEVEGERDRLRKALDEIWEWPTSQPIALNMPDDRWPWHLISQIRSFARSALEDQS